MSPPPKLSRRSLTVGGIAVAVTAAVAGAVYEVPKLFKHRAKGQYADLVNLLDDPDQAAAVGRAVHTNNIDVPIEEFVVAPFKKRLAGRPLAALAVEDSARGLVAEAGGWVIPQAVAEICLLAAS